MSRREEQRYIYVGSFAVDREQSALYRKVSEGDGVQPVRIQDRTLALLIELLLPLLAEPPEVGWQRKRAIMERVWNDRFVEPANLSQQLYQLREIVPREWIDSSRARLVRYVGPPPVASDEAPLERWANERPMQDSAPARRRLPWRLVAMIATGAMIATVMLLSARSFESSNPATPDRARLGADAIITARVEDGKLLLGRRSGATSVGEPDPWLRPPDHIHHAQPLEVLLLEDIDGDGEVEVVVPATDPVNGDSHLRCYDVAGVPRWTTRFGATLATRDGTLENAFHIDRIILTEGHVVAAGRHDIRFASIIQLIDPLTGREIDRYLHPGGVSILSPIDLDHDGRDELIVGGTYNPGPVRGVPGLAVLDVPFRHRERADGEPENYFGAGNRKERLYLMLPSTDVARRTDQITQFSDRLRRPAGLRLSALVPDGGGIILDLDDDLRLISGAVSSDMRRRHQSLHVDRGELDHELSAAEIEEWTRLIRLPTAPTAEYLRAIGFLRDDDFVR